MTPNLKLTKRGRLLAGIAIGALILSGAARPAAAVDPPITVNGTSETYENQDIETTNASDYGAQVLNGGNLTLNSSSITTSGLTAPGLYSLGGGSTITATDVLIKTFGDQSFGVQAQYGGTVTLGNLNIFSTIATSGLGAYGIYATGDDNGTPAYVSGYGLVITTEGVAAHGVVAEGLAKIDLDSSQINTYGDMAIGLQAISGATITATNVSVNTSGDNSHGVVAQDGGQVNLTNVGIYTGMSPDGSTPPTGGASAFGIYAVGGNDNGTPATISGNAVIVQTTGNNAHGVFAQYGGQVNLSYYVDYAANQVYYTKITTTGSSAYGLYAEGGDDNGKPASISGDNVTVLTTGDGAHGLVAQGLAKVDLTHSSVTTQGAGAALIFSRSSESLTPGSDTGPSTVNITNSVLESVQGDGIVVTGAGAASPVSALTVNLSNSILVSDAGAWLVAETDGTNTAAATVTANSSNVTGSARTDAGSTTDVTLSNGSVWTMTGSSNLTNLQNNTSEVDFTAPLSTDDPRSLASYKTLTVGNYSGAGGAIVLNSYLGGDGSPSDRLVIDSGGSATGNTFLAIINAGGPGALTTSSGILVVDATTYGGATAMGAFSLYNRVVAGPYEYNLFHGGVGAEAGNDNWYLRSTGYRPEVGSYLANQHMASDLLVHSLHDRLGGPQWLNDSKDEARDSLWLRLGGKDISSTGKNGVFDVDSTQFSVQGGGDIAEWSEFSDNDRLHLGVMAGYGAGSSSATAQGNPAKSKSIAQGFSLGLYGTWFQHDDTHLGWYTDIWGQYGWFTNQVRGDFLPEVRYDSQAMALSAEVGYAHQESSTGLVIEPQAQLIYTSSSQDDVTELNGTRVTADDGTGWVSRLGVRVHRTWTNKVIGHIQPYLTVNWWHDATSNTVAFNQTSISDLYPQDRGEIKLGINAEWGGGWSGWANIGGESGDQSYHAYTGRIGVKLSW